MCLNEDVTISEMLPIITEQLESGGSVSFNIHGTSMTPFLKDGKSAVRLKKCEKSPKKYDIIFYRRENGQFILHRIVGIKDGAYICRGDNQTENEFPVKKSSVIASVTEYKTGKAWRSVNSLPQRLYAWFRVNSVFLLKGVRKAVSLIRKSMKRKDKI